MPAAHLEFDDERILFRLDDIGWSDGKTGDHGSIPPCLRVHGESVELEAQVIKLSAQPFNSGSYWQVVAVTCPSG